MLHAYSGFDDSTMFSPFHNFANSCHLWGLDGLIHATVHLIMSTYLNSIQHQGLGQRLTQLPYPGKYL